jgi:hypothetical protein
MNRNSCVQTTDTRHPRSRPWLGAVALAAATAACSGGQDSTDFETSLLDEDVAQHPFEAQENREPLPPPLICAKRGDTDAATGLVHRFDETYIPRVINTELRNSSELRAALGFDEVASCEDAREWASKRNAIIEGEPPVTEERRRAGAAQPAEKILNGEFYKDDSVIMINSALTCSAVMIGPKLALTAGHCVPGNDRNCLPGLPCNAAGTNDVGVTRALDAGGNNAFIGTFNAVTYLHPQYGGGAVNDLAIVYFQNWSDHPANSRPILLSNVTSGMTLSAYGWGHAAVEGNDTFGQLRRDRLDDSFIVDWVSGGGHNYFYDDDDAGTNLCAGDSGGPAFRNTGLGRRKIGGIASSLNFWISPNTCSPVDPGGRIYWQRPAAQLAWVEQVVAANGQCPSGGSPCCVRIESNSAARCY